MNTLNKSLREECGLGEEVDPSLLYTPLDGDYYGELLYSLYDKEHALVVYEEDNKLSIAMGSHYEYADAFVSLNKEEVKTLIKVLENFVDET